MNDLSRIISRTIRDVPDFPKPGIVFKDITPVLSDPRLLSGITKHFHRAYAHQKVDVVVGIESRGFIFGAPLAIALGSAFVPVRKPGKLPYSHLSQSYDLEYGSAELQIHTDAIRAGQRVLIVDDLLATGGTAAATKMLVEELKGEVMGCAFVVNLTFLDGASKLPGIHIESIVSY